MNVREVFEKIDIEKDIKSYELAIQELNKINESLSYNGCMNLNTVCIIKGTLTNTNSVKLKVVYKSRWLSIRTFFKKWHKNYYG